MFNCSYHSHFVYILESIESQLSGVYVVIILYRGEAEKVKLQRWEVHCRVIFGTVIKFVFLDFGSLANAGF